MLIKPQGMTERALHSSIHSDGRIIYAFLDNIFANDKNPKEILDPCYKNINDFKTCPSQV